MSTAPLPLFDTLEHIQEMLTAQDFDSPEQYKSYQYAQAFLKCYIGSKGTFNSYRREVERLLHWTHHIAKKTLTELRREDVEAFLYFCQKPQRSWIGTKKVRRFIVVDGSRYPNPEWRPFVVTQSKSAHKRGTELSVEQFSLSQGALREVLAILSSFFNYCIQEDYCVINPIALMRQKSKFFRSMQSSERIRRLSELQWEYVIETAKNLAGAEPEVHERTLFIMSALYSMYLRISELTSTPRWQPIMKHFFKDQDELWWFVTVGKGNKQREIAVSDTMLEALKRWRTHLQLTPLPSPADNTPIIPKLRGTGPVSNTNVIRRIVQNCFDQAIDRMRTDGFDEDADYLMEATVHWLRHTGISDDVRKRPREHVRDDAGHSSSAITDKYIDIGKRERHESAKRKPISHDD